MKPARTIAFILPLFILLSGCQMTLHRAVDRNNLALVENMLQQGADINKKINGWTPLMTAVYHGNLIIAEYLVKQGADLNLQKDRIKSYTDRFDGFTALHFAAFYGNTGIARILIDAGADLTIKDDKLMTARDYARQYSFGEIVRLIEDAQQKKQ